MKDKLFSDTSVVKVEDPSLKKSCEHFKDFWLSWKDGTIQVIYSDILCFSLKHQVILFPEEI